MSDWLFYHWPIYCSNSGTEKKKRAFKYTRKCQEHVKDLKAMVALGPCLVYSHAFKRFIIRTNNSMNVEDWLLSVYIPPPGQEFLSDLSFQVWFTSLNLSHFKEFLFLKVLSNSNEPPDVCCKISVALYTLSSLAHKQLFFYLQTASTCFKVCF